jgi:omega-6 fatty acid desaturase (delta-12 desaturase)
MSLALAPKIRIEPITETAPPPREAPAVDRRSLGKAVRVLGVHSALYVATLLGALAPLPLALNIAFAITNGVFIALLFIIGHDAAHGGFVPSRKLNAWIARFAFVPCVHSVSLWRVIHNRLHHGYTNLKGKDGVWAPMSKAEYDAAHPLRRWLERVYRGPFGPLIYYYGEFWIHRVVLPLAPAVRNEWKRHLPDSLFVISAFALTLGAILAGGAVLAPERPLWQVLLIGWVIPFAVWNYLMAFTTYLNHTHPSIVWFNDEALWRRYRGNLMDTANVVMPVNIVPLYTKVMSHPAHHQNMKVPVYALPEAQAELNAAFGKQVEYTLMPAEYRRIYRACKLFDFERMCWTDFDGVPTS